MRSIDDGAVVHLPAAAVVRTRLSGGLGNQLFQLAASIALAGPRGSSIELFTGGLGAYRVQRAFELPRLLRLPENIKVVSEDTSFAARALAARIGRLPWVGVSDHNFPVALKAGKPRSLWLDGYFQHGWPWLQFQDSLQAIRSLLREASIPVAGGVECALHVRGADFLTNDMHRVVTEDFYLQALQALRRKHVGLRRVTIVTDDPPHARKTLTALARHMTEMEFVIPETGGGWESDFALLHRARLRILGNSTFSWWAAALDSSRSPTVGPTQWLKGVRRDLVLPWEETIEV